MPGEGLAAPSGAHPAGALQAQAAPLIAQPSDSLSQQAHPSQGECPLLVYWTDAAVFLVSLLTHCASTLKVYHRDCGLLLFAFIWSLVLKQTAWYKGLHARDVCKSLRPVCR